MNDNVHFFSRDNRRDIAHPGDREATLTFCAEHFVNCAKEAVKKHHFFSVALSGGSTPKTLYQKITHPPYSSEIDWEKCFLFWSDERCVPPTDPKSNFWMAMEAGFHSVSIPKQQIFRMKGEGTPLENARSYEQTIHAVLKERPFDLVMLGVGKDGHTASLFPHSDALREEKKWVVATKAPTSPKNRITLTFPCMNRAVNTVVYALGEEKAPIVKKVLSSLPDPSLPASFVGKKENKALWILDSGSFKLVFP